MFNVINEDYLSYGDDEIRIPRGLRFLVVDDEKEVANLIAESVDEMGFNGKISFSSSVEKAIERIKPIESVENNPIDFIFCDWNIGELSGLDFLIEVRKNPILKDIPFLMVTANDNVSGMLVATKKGCSDYLVKPFSFEELALKIAVSWDKHN